MPTIRIRKENQLLINGIISTLFCLAIGGIIYGLAYRAIVSNVKASLSDIAVQGASRIEDKLEGYLDILETISTLDPIRDPAQPWKDKYRVIEVMAERNYLDLKRISISDTRGFSRTSDGKTLYVGDRPYFKKAMAGISNVSDPIVSRVDNTLVIVFAVPVYYQGRISSVLYATHSVDALNQITRKIQLGKDSYSFIVDKQNRMIAEDLHPHGQFGLPAPHTKLMMTSQTGAEEYNDHGIPKYLGFAPIKNTDWSFGISVPKKTVFRSLNNILKFFALLFFLMFALFGLVNLNNMTLRKLLRREKVFLDTAIDTANIVILEIDREGLLLGFNRFAKEKLDYEREEILKHRTLYDLTPPSFTEQVGLMLQSWDGHKSAGDRWEFPLIRKNGELIHLIWSIHPAERNVKFFRTITLMGIDITERVRYENKLVESNQKLTSLYKNLATSEELLREQFEELSATQERLVKSDERYQLAQEGSNDILWDWDLKNRQIYFSSKFNEFFGYSDGEFSTPSSYLPLFHQDDLPMVKASFQEYLASDTTFFSAQFRMLAKNGEYKWILCRGKAVENGSGSKIRMAGSLTDITARRFQEETIQKLAYYDSLTELPNRVLLYERSAAIIQQAVLRGTQGFLFFLDVDNFKLVNDSFGHTIGDKVLVAIGARLRSVVSECDVYRLSGDEFVAISRDAGKTSDVRQLADQVLAAFAKPISVQNHIFHITISIGAALFPEHGDNIEDLLKNADTAMYQAKEHGKSQYVIFDQSMKEQIMEKMAMESSLRKALENHEFFLAFQPQIELSTGLVTGFEALLRWKSPIHGLVSPVKFIPVAEENGLIIPIGLWVLDQACRFAARLKDESLDDLSVSINISTRQLLQNDFVERVRRSVNSYGVDPNRVILEITESALMESFDINAEKLRTIAAEGIEIHLDDFGTGYSSLSYLRKLPISIVKIDKSFVADYLDGIDQPLIGAIIAMAHQLGLRVIAEGVETKDQAAYLLDGQCDAVQGYLFSKPVTEEEALRIAKVGSFSLE